MSALDILTPQNQNTGIADYVPTTFSENVGAAFGDTMFRSRANVAPYAIDNTSFRARDEKIRERFGVADPFDLIDKKAIEEKYSNPTIEGRIAMLNEKQDALDNFIKQNREDPRLQGIKTRDEIEEFTKTVARQARREFEETQSRAGPVTGFAGALAGGIAGAFTDPINLATLPLGAGASMGTIRAMGAEAIANMAIEAIEAPLVYKWQNELGFKYGAGEVTADILTAGIGGAAFTGIVRGAGHGLRAAGSKSMRVLDTIAERAAPEQREALKYQSRVAHIDETIPIERPIQREDIRVQRETVQELQNAIEEYRQPDLREAQEKYGQFLEQAREIKQQLSDIPDFNKPSDLKKVLGYTPETLTQFIKKQGGINISGIEGELKQIEAGKLPGLVRKSKATEATARGVRTIDNQIDVVKEKAFDAGFFPGKQDYNEISNDEFIEAINNDLSGKHVFKEDDLEAIAIAQENQDIVAKFDRKGITFDMSEKEIAQRLSEINNIESPHIIETNPAQDMRVSIENAEGALSAFDADFARLAENEPDTKIIIDGEERTLRQIQEEFTKEQNILQAIKTCAVG